MISEHPGYLGHCIRFIVSGEFQYNQTEDLCFSQVALFDNEAELCLSVQQVSVLGKIETSFNAFFLQTVAEYKSSVFIEIFYRLGIGNEYFASRVKEKNLSYMG